MAFFDNNDDDVQIAVSVERTNFFSSQDRISSLSESHPEDTEKNDKEEEDDDDDVDYCEAILEAETEEYDVETPTYRGEETMRTLNNEDEKQGEEDDENSAWKINDPYESWSSVKPPAIKSRTESSQGRSEQQRGSSLRYDRPHSLQLTGNKLIPKPTSSQRLLPMVPPRPRSTSDPNVRLPLNARQLKPVTPSSNAPTADTSTTATSASALKSIPNVERTGSTTSGTSRQDLPANSTPQLHLQKALKPSKPRIRSPMLTDLDEEEEETQRVSSALGEEHKSAELGMEEADAAAELEAETEADPIQPLLTQLQESLRCTSRALPPLTMAVVQQQKTASIYLADLLSKDPIPLLPAVRYLRERIHRLEQAARLVEGAVLIEEATTQLVDATATLNNAEKVDKQQLMQIDAADADRSSTMHN